MCTHHGHDRRPDVRCRCCDPSARRGAYRIERLHERGWDDAEHGEPDADYCAATTGERAAMAENHSEGGYDPSPTVRTARARSGHLDEDEQDRLATDESPRVRAALASNPETSPPTLDALADDEDRRVREAVAKHAHTPSQAVARMARNLDRRRDLSVAQALASNRNTPPEAMREWIESGTGGWRAIARRALRERAGAAAVAAAGHVLDGAERVGSQMEAGVGTSADGLDEALGLEPERAAKVA